MNQVSEQEKLQVRLQAVYTALGSDAVLQIEQMLDFLHPAEVADLLESLPQREREKVWEMVRKEREGDVLVYTNDDVRAALISQMATHDVAAATEGLDADDVADILQDLPPEVAEDILQVMGAQDRTRLEEILSYPEDTAGGLMNTDVLTVRQDVTLDVVARYLRRRGSLPDKTDAFIVVDRANLYQGMVPLSTVLVCDPEVLVSDVMDTARDPILADLPETDVARIFEAHDLISAPVVNQNNELVGRITIDDVVDVIREEGEQSLLSTAGLDIEDDMFAPVFESARGRAVWLGVNLATAFLAAWVIGLFEATLDQIVALAILMPVVASMGGIAGSQTLTLVIRGIALGQIGLANARSLMIKELYVGALNGVFWALVVALVAYAWFDDLLLGAIIALAIVINLITAALAGALVPLGLNKLKIDPALAGGVILTTVTDVIGFWAFLGLASIFMLP